MNVSFSTASLHLKTTDWLMKWKKTHDLGFKMNTTCHFELPFPYSLRSNQSKRWISTFSKLSIRLAQRWYVSIIWTEESTYVVMSKYIFEDAKPVWAFFREKSKKERQETLPKSYLHKKISMNLTHLKSLEPWCENAQI